MGQNDILGILGSNKKKIFTMKELCDITGYNYSSVTTSVRKLELDGFVRVDYVPENVRSRYRFSTVLREVKAVGWKRK